MAYPSKILLFGEHSVIKGSKALAMPFENFSGTWRLSPSGLLPENAQRSLYDLAEYLDRMAEDLPLRLDVSRFRGELAGGLYFDSDIPVGYGAGSSGALCAAVFDRYARGIRPADPAELRRILGQIESFFHGSSSGTDPLVSYLKAPVEIEPDKGIRVLPPLNFDRSGAFSLFLLDTKIKRATSPFVNLFLQKCEENSYLTKVREVLLPLNDLVIKATLNQEWEMVFGLFEEISAFQEEHFLEMIPAMFRPLWRDALKSDTFKLKICGAGGGGFLLGISRDIEPESHEVLKHYQTIKISS